MLLLPATAGVADAAPPDGRGYELVSPFDTNGTDIYNLPFGGYGQAGTVIAADDGERVYYSSFAAFAGAPSTGVTGYTAYRASRFDDGWETNTLQPPMTGPPVVANGAGSPVGLTPDIRYAFVISNQALAPGIPADYAGRNIFRQEPDGSFTLLGTQIPRAVNQPNWVGTSDDGSHAVFESAELVPGAGANLYEWVDGTVRAVGVLPNGTFAVGAQAAGKDHVDNAVRHRQVSADGSHVYFTSNAGGKRELYVRIDGSRTVAVSASQRTPVDPAATAATARLFWGASEDGRVAWFTSREALTDDANTGAADAGSDLYRYDLDSGELTDVSVSAHVARGANVRGVLGTSADGSTAYFVTENRVGAEGADGAYNLYVHRDGETRFIGALAATDAVNWRQDAGTHATARVTPDGGQLLFVSVAQLTGYDNRHATTNVVQKQVFRFDATADPADALTCISCNPSGERPLGSSDIQAFQSAKTSNPTGSLPRNISDDGSRVFFNSADRLVPAAVNGRFNPYMWENGTLHLLSSGTAAADAYFGDASASGDDAFFTTSEPLLALGQSDKVALWDARIGGGFPLPTPPRQCSGDACQGPPAQQQRPQDPASTRYVGNGNVVEPPERVPSLKVTPLTAAQQRALARGGRAVVVVTVGGAGRVTIAGTARLPGTRSLTTVLGNARVATEGRMLRIPVRLSSAARRALAGGRSLTVRFAVSQERVGVRRQTLRLPGAARAAKRPVHSSTRSR
ncbi:hypothetical protein VSS74_29485 [Conexibacter stalactiti]|uniref:Uncharacterized protein n=1 Tax=Conexibacter stalactiti TaxID=1940611 RepID=A0ABU4HZ77_9ACTN|nr:hypothetical protein [Conexibacter stalactiti]MDW5598530.1 hypothetical protein [Conexibacter stalactiti]MEC5039172.1 hypothetical protein [Conexibacter stalactiti]